MIYEKPQVITVIYHSEYYEEWKCSCIKSARKFGLAIPYGTDAINIKPNTTIRVGVGVLFNEEQGHIGVVTSIQEDGFWYKEGGYKIDDDGTCHITEKFIQWDDQRSIDYLLGFFDPLVSISY